METRINEDGFIQAFAVSDLVNTPFSEVFKTDNQLEAEKLMREAIVSKREQTLDSNLLSEVSFMPYYSYSNIFVDRSSFYSTPNKVEFFAATTLISDCEQELNFTIWSYMSLALYHNGVLCASIEPPCYKPIKKKEFQLRIQKGENHIVLKCENMGVRDTYNIFALQLTSSYSGIRAELPFNMQKEYKTAFSFLDNLKIENSTIVFPFEADEDAYISYPKESSEYIENYKEECIKIGKQTSFKLGNEHSIITVHTKGISRQLQLLEAVKPEYLDIADDEERYKETLRRIAQTKTLDRGDHGFSVFNILARKALGIDSQEDEMLLKKDFGHIKRRVDCSDFIIQGLLRYMKNYPLSDELKQIAKETLLSFRYWMDMKGTDGMCFWSENHSLMFYLAAVLAGEMYPEDYFVLADMTGKQLQAYGEKRLEEWLDDVEAEGFEEFQSAVYMCVTFAALLNVVDFAKEEFAKKAERILNTLISSLALQTFDHAVISPMGRVYRDVIFPFNGAANSILSIPLNGMCYSEAEGWVSFFATSKYKFSKTLQDIATTPIDTSYTTGNARINIKKCDDYILTSLASPREKEYKRWENTILSGHGDTSCHSFVKSLNERFHGTSFINPGTLGYQQHMWYAALSNEAVLFINHPGTSAEQSSLRPGFWYGNGVMPQLKQEGKELYGIYALTDKLPINFVHAFLPKSKFDEYRTNGNWIFLRKNNGYIAFYCSEKGQEHSDMLFESELRYKNNHIGFYVKMGCYIDDSSFENFINETLKTEIDFNFPRLIKDGKEKLKYEKYEDKTQYID